MKKIMISSFCLLLLFEVEAQLRVKTKPAANTSVDLNVNVNKHPKTSDTDKSTPATKTNATMPTPDTASNPTIQPDDSYKGPAKTYVNSFFRELNSIQTKGLGSSSVNNLERALGMIKEKDPSYNTSSMEEVLKIWKEKNEQETAARLAKPNQNQENMDRNRKETMAKLKLEDLLGSVFDISIISIRNVETAQAENDAYKAKAEQLMGMSAEIAAYKADPKTSSKYFNLIDRMKITHSRTFNSFLQRVESIMTTSTEAKGNWQNSWYEMRAEQIHWNAAQKVFPQEPLFAEAYQKISSAISKYGSLDDIAAKSAANKIEQIKNTKLPAPVVRDARLEKIVVDHFNKVFVGDKATALKAVLTQDGWTTLRNPITSVITGRERTAKVAYKANDGKCYMIIDYIFIREEYIGSSFVNTKAVFTWLDGKEMLCENVK